jgi:amino acid permease
MPRSRFATLVPSLMLVGATVGVGIFSVPATLAGVGPWWAVGMCVGVGALMLVLQLLYMEVALATPEQARLPGFARHWLGEGWRWLAALGTVGSSMGALVAYVLVGGGFARALTGAALGGEFGPLGAWQLGMGACAALAIALGLRSFARLDALATGCLVTAALAVVGVASTRADWGAVLATPSGGGAQAALTYGVLVFAFTGAPVIPLMEELVRGNRAAYRRSIIAGTAVAWCVTVAFGFAVWAAFGGVTPSELPAAFGRTFGVGAMALLALFGLLSTFTAYLASATNLRDALTVDLRVPPRAAWAFVALLPIGIALATRGDVLRVIGWTGAVFGGVAAVTICATFVGMQRKARAVRVPRWLAWLVLACTVLGALVEIGRETVAR